MSSWSSYLRSFSLNIGLAVLLDLSLIVEDTLGGSLTPNLLLDAKDGPRAGPGLYPRPSSAARPRLWLPS